MQSDSWASATTAASRPEILKPEIMLFPPPTPNQSGTRCGISSLNSRFRTRPVSCSRAAQGREPGLPSVHHCRQATALGHSLATLSEAPSLGPLPSSDPSPSQLPQAPQAPPRLCSEAAGAEGVREPRPAVTALEELGSGGGGLVPCSVCSVKFVPCKESLNSCIFKRENLI